MKNRVIYHNEGKGLTIWLFLMVILFLKVYKITQKLPPISGKVNLPWFCGNIEQVIPIYVSNYNIWQQVYTNFSVPNIFKL